MSESDLDRISADGRRLECRWWGERRAGAPVLVLLHEGLGCTEMWRDFPEALALETDLPVFAYTRAGYAASDPVPLPRPVDYMHHEGRVVLPQVLAAAGIDDAILVGHSDGASIAIVHTGAGNAGVRGLVLLAPHVFAEDVCIASIRAAGEAFDGTDLREKLARYHGSRVDEAFRGWHDVWLDPEFRHWNIEEYLPGIDVPTLVLQGADDPYGTVAQVDAIEAGSQGRVQRVWLPRCGHAPHRDRRHETLSAVAVFLRVYLGETRAGSARPVRH